MTRFHGKGHAEGNTSKVFDEADLPSPVIEPTGVFIMTRRVVMRNQKFGSCVDWDNPEACPCVDGSVCNGEYCESQGWCPSLGDNNAQDPPKGAEVDDIAGLEDAVLSIQAGIFWPFSGNYLYVAQEQHSSRVKLKNITLAELLGLAEPPMTLKEISKKGALIGVHLLWRCELTTWRNMMGDHRELYAGVGDGALQCPYHLVVNRLDGGQGFARKRAAKKREGGEESRDSIYTSGLRIVVQSSGVGNRTSMVLLMVQLGCMFSLLKLAGVITDWWMLNKWLPTWLVGDKVRRDAYMKCKVEWTEDKSDLSDRIDQVHKERRDFGSPSASRRAGLGLGQGGRGGSGRPLR